MNYVLDTNIVVRLLDGDERVLRRLRNVEPRDVGIPLVVFAELLYGAERSARRQQNQARVEALVTRLHLIFIGPAIARRYASVRAEVERRGRSKSDFDLLIACTALEHAATLVTHDGALQDSAIDGLRVEDWLSAAP